MKDIVIGNRYNMIHSTAGDDTWITCPVKVVAFHGEVVEIVDDDGASGFCPRDKLLTDAEMVATGRSIFDMRQTG